MNAQQEFILVQLSREPKGLTAEELRERTHRSTDAGLRRTLAALERCGFLRSVQDTEEGPVHHLTDDGRFVVRWMVPAPHHRS